MVNLIISVMIAIVSLVIPAEILPPCDSEDGFGVSVCEWDGIVSGDCAPEYVGGILISALCIQKHEENGEAVKQCVMEYNLNNIPNVGKCIRDI